VPYSPETHNSEAQFCAIETAPDRDLNVFDPSLRMGYRSITVLKMRTAKSLMRGLWLVALIRKGSTGFQMNKVFQVLQSLQKGSVRAAGHVSQVT
jgi:hypothetical protein